MPYAILSISPPLTSALERLQTNPFRETPEEYDDWLESIDEKISLRDIVQQCLLELSATVRAMGQNGQQDDQAARSHAIDILKAIRLALISAADKSLFDHRLAAQAGIDHIINEIDEALKRLDTNFGKRSTQSVMSMLADEFDVEEIEADSTSADTVKMDFKNAV